MIECKALTATRMDGIRNLDLKLQNGDVYGIVGDRAGGRSVFLSLLSGILEPASGEILINGFSLLKSPKRAKKYIGYLNAHDALHENFTVAEQLFFAADIRRLDYDSALRRAESLLESLGLLSKKSTLVRTLSPLERRRLSLAQAMLGDPEFLLLDDPFDSLRPRDAERFLETVEAISDSKTVLLASADPALVRTVCDRVLCFRGGEAPVLLSPEDPILDTLDPTPLPMPPKKKSRLSLLFDRGEGEE